MENGETRVGSSGERKLKELAPGVVDETKEPTLDVAIEMALGTPPNLAQIEAEGVGHGEEKPEQANEFIEKLHRIQPDIDAFLVDVDARFTETEQFTIREALRLMIKIHIEQPDRSDTEIPFIGHPLAVAHNALRIARDHEDAFYICMAGLLHDSVEDQSKWLTLEKQIAAVHQWYDKPREEVEKEIERHGALGAIERVFDRRVRLLVEALTSPLTTEQSLENTADKNAQYFEYIQNIFYNQDASPSVIKWADLKENALTIGLVRERANEAAELGDTVKAERLERFHEKLKRKYKPVLEAVLTFFENLTDGYHPLFTEKEQAIQDIQLVLEHEYYA